MCFYAPDDYDWTASVSEESDTVAPEQTFCDECGDTVLAGDFLHTLHMREVEEGGCRDCEDGGCECEDGKCCQCDPPEPGETFDYERCYNCHRFLEAVHLTETKAGCPDHSARPQVGAMIDDISSGNLEESEKYFAEARVLFPDMEASGFLARIWKSMWFDRAAYRASSVEVL